MTTLISTCHPSSAVMRRFFFEIECFHKNSTEKFDLILLNSLNIDLDSYGPISFSGILRIISFDSFLASDQSSAIAYGVGFSKSESVLIIDPDMGGSILFFSEMKQKLEEGFDVVVACRKFSPSRSFFRYFGSFFLNILVSIYFGYRIKDFNSPMMLIKKEVIEDIAAVIECSLEAKFLLYERWRNRLVEVSVIDSSQVYNIRSTYRFLDLLKMLFHLIRIMLRLSMR